MLCLFPKILLKQLIFVKYCDNYGNITTNIDQITDAYEDFLNNGSDTTTITNINNNNNTTNNTTSNHLDFDYSKYAYGLEASIDQF